MGSVSSSSTFGSSINSDVVDGEIFKIFSIGVGLEIINKAENNSDRLLRPSTEGFSELSSLSGSTNSTKMFKIRDTSSMSEDILKVLFSLGNGEALDSVGSFIGVLIMDSEILG
jgi:hypothetical protein